MAGQKTDDRDVLLGRRIAERRKRAALTQRRVADSFGMSAAQLQKYEKGTNRISAIHLEILSRMTGVPITDFFEGMARTDGNPEAGFTEAQQSRYEADSAWNGLAVAMARHVTETFNSRDRRTFATAVGVLVRELNTPRQAPARTEPSQT